MNKSRKNNLIEMLEKEPNDLFLNYALAIEYAGEGDLEKSEKQFLKVLEIDNNYLPCYYQLGQTAEKLNKEKEALGYYNKGIEIAKNQSNNKTLNELNEAIWMLDE